MTDVRDNAPSAAAAAPRHPEHPRWLKERTLAIEVKHAQQTGGSLRDAEAANQRSLERLDARKRERRPVMTPGKVAREKQRQDRRERRREKLQVTVKPVAPIVKPVILACGRCGQCIHCRREMRVAAIMAKGRQGDAAMAWLVNNLVALMFALQKRIDCKIAPSASSLGKEVAFSMMRLAGERNTAFVSAAAEICDWSVRSMGPWR